VEDGETYVHEICETNPCVLRALKPARHVRVAGASGDCAAARFETIDLHAGANAVTVRCGPPRIIQGVVHVSGGGPPALLRVRCPDGTESDVQGSFVFDLQCPSDARAIEWTLDASGAWQNVPLGDGPNPLLVELRVPGG